MDYNKGLPKVGQIWAMDDEKRGDKPKHMATITKVNKEKNRVYWTIKYEDKTKLPCSSNVAIFKFRYDTLIKDVEE